MLPGADTGQGDKPWDRCLITILMKGEGKGLFEFYFLRDKQNFHFRGNKATQFISTTGILLNQRTSKEERRQLHFFRVNDLFTLKTQRTVIMGKQSWM